MEEKYNVKTKSSDINKKEFNKQIFLYAKEGVRNKYSSIVLDAETIKTTRTLKCARFVKKNIHIPNPFAYSVIKSRHPNTYNMLLSELLNNTEKYNIRAVSMAIFDYCCSVDGNKTTKIFPMQDIQKLFSKRLLIDNSILSVTCCWRNSKKSEFLYNDMIKLIAFATQIANKYSYIAEVLKTSKTYKGMFYVFFRIQKK